MTPIAVTDTHALFWYASGRPRKLGRNARRVFERADSGRAAIYVPVLVLVEIGELISRGIFRTPGGFLEWMRALFASGRFLPAELTIDVIETAEQLRSIPERMDRLIAATAAHRGVPLITRDADMTRAGLSVIW